MIRGFHVWGDSLFRGISYDEKRKRHFIISSPPVDCAALAIGLPVINHARMGNTVLEGYRCMLQTDPMQFKNSVVLLEFGGNDCDFEWEKVAENPKDDHQCHVPPEIYQKTLHAMIDTVFSMDSIPVMTTLPPLDAEHYFEWITRRGIDRQAVLAFLGDVQQIYRWQEYYSQMNLRIAKERNVRCLPIRERFLSSSPRQCYLSEDGIHPNENGYRLMADIMIAQWKTHANCLQ